MTYRVYTSIDEIATEWDSFLPENRHLLSIQLRALEKSEIEDLSVYYLLFYDLKGSTVAKAYFQYFPFTRAHYSYPISKNPVLRWVENRVTRNGFRILTLGNLLCVNAPSLVYNEKCTSASEIFQLLEGFYLTLSPSLDAILIKDWQTELGTKWVKSSKFVEWQADLTMKLALNPSWKSMNDYVASLRHHYAQRFRKVRRQRGSVQRRELSLADLISLKPEITQLYLNVVERQSIRLVIINGTYFIEMKKSHGDKFRVSGYFLENELIAFSSSIDHPDHWELHYIGLNYHYNKQHDTYFNILYDAIEDAINAGRKELELGRTARNTKALIGAKPAYFSNYVRFRNKKARLVTGLLRRSFNNINRAKGSSSNPYKKN